MLRAEGMDGSVMTYNGSSYFMKDTNNKKVIIPDSLTKPSDMAGIYWNIFNVVLKVYSDSANIAKAGKIEYIGSEILDGQVCDVLYFTKLYEGNVMNTYMSISQSDNILRKLYGEIVKDNKIISITKFLVEDLKINQPLDDSLFIQKIPESYKIEYFNLK
jgi:outer membrane lipoprotein-sorting protein